MTVKELKDRVSTLINTLEDKAQDIAIITAKSGLSVVKERSIEDGIFKDGKSGNYVKYSQKQVPTFFFKGKELNKKGTDYIKENKTGTWQGFSEAQGRKKKDDNINLSYSNRMWTSLEIVKTGIFNDYAIASIGTTDAEVEKYIVFLVEKYGNYIRPTEKEIQDLINDATQELVNYIIQILFR